MLGYAHSDARNRDRWRVPALSLTALAIALPCSACTRRPAAFTSILVSSRVSAGTASHPAPCGPRPPRLPRRCRVGRRPASATGSTSASSRCLIFPAYLPARCPRQGRWSVTGRVTRWPAARRPRRVGPAGTRSRHHPFGLKGQCPVRPWSSCGTDGGVSVGTGASPARCAAGAHRVRGSGLTVTCRPGLSAWPVLGMIAVGPRARATR